LHSLDIQKTIEKACIDRPFANTMSAHGQASNQLTRAQQFKIQIHFFRELSANNLRTFFHDELF